MRRTFLLVCWVIADYVLFVGAYTLGYPQSLQTFTWAPFPIGSYLRTVVIIATVLAAGTRFALRVFTSRASSNREKHSAHSVRLRHGRIILRSLSIFSTTRVRSVDCCWYTWEHSAFSSQPCGTLSSMSGSAKSCARIRLLTLFC